MATNVTNIKRHDRGGRPEQTQLRRLLCPENDGNAPETNQFPSAQKRGKGCSGGQHGRAVVFDSESKTGQGILYWNSSNEQPDEQAIEEKSRIMMDIRMKQMNL